MRWSNRLSGVDSTDLKRGVKSRSGLKTIDEMSKVNRIVKVIWIKKGTLDK